MCVWQVAACVCVCVCVNRMDVEWAQCECYVSVCKICVCSGGQMHVPVCGRLMGMSGAGEENMGAWGGWSCAQKVYVLGVLDTCVYGQWER